MNSFEILYVKYLPFLGLQIEQDENCSHLSQPEVIQPENCLFLFDQHSNTYIPFKGQGTYFHIILKMVIREVKSLNKYFE